MTTIKIRSGFRAALSTYLVLKTCVEFLISPIVELVESARDKKLVLATAKPVVGSTDFSNYKEATIETREIQDSKGRILGRMKLWIYPHEKKCFREVTFISQLLMASVGMNRLSFPPLDFGKGDTPLSLFEITTRDFETWLRHRTPGTQFGIESARNAAAKPQPVRVVSVMPEEPPPVAAQQFQPKLEPVSSVPPVARFQAAPQMRSPAPGAVSQFANAPAHQSDQVKQFQRAEPRPEIKAKAEEYTIGLLQSVGMQDRTTGNRQFKQYCFDILLTDGEQRGMVKRIWGADLERALGESRALLGNKVEVCHHGSIPMPNSSGGSSYKNSYSMRVLR